MDVHYKFSKVTFRDGQGRVVTRERINHPDREALRAWMEEWPKGVPIVMEASFGWGWLSDLMLELNLDPQLSNCAKVEQMRQARGWAKTNGKDADLASLLPAEREEWWRVWMAPPDVRDHREWMRYRSDLVAIQTQTKNRIHAIFHRHGVFHDFSDLFGTGGRGFLRDLCRDGGARLSGGALAALRGQVLLLLHVRAQLATIVRQLRKVLGRDRLVQHLDGISGIGLILAHTMVAEIGRLERFGGQKQLASYSLLAPRANDTGQPRDPDDPPLGRRLGRRGNRTLKWAFIEAAHGAVRHGGKWRAMFDRYTDGGRRNRGRGYIKVARALVKVVWGVWKNDMPYVEDGLRRPGSAKSQPRARGNSRSGTGQPSHAMVVV